MLSRRTGEAHEHAGAGLGRARTRCCARCRTPAPSGTPNSYRRLLPESRLPSTDEPPAQEPNQSSSNSYHGHRDACYGAGGEAGITITSSAIPHEVTKDSQCGRWITALSIHIGPSMRSVRAAQPARRCTRARRSTLGCLPRRYVCIRMHKHMEQQLGRDRSAGSVARRHSAPRPQGSTALCGSGGPGGPRGTRYRPHAI